jgi:hypothetical protein
MHFLLKDELPVTYRRCLNISRNRLNDGGTPSSIVRSVRKRNGS